jgi:hypothetical protein
VLVHAVLLSGRSIVDASRQLGGDPERAHAEVADGQACWSTSIPQDPDSRPKREPSSAPSKHTGQGCSMALQS